MRTVIFFFFILLISSCLYTDNLKKGTNSIPHAPYEISIVDPNGPNNFYHQLRDSLNSYIEKISGNNLGDPDAMLGWLQDQFDNQQSGLGHKASSESETERTSDESFLKKKGAISNDKISFSVDFQTDSIPKELLYPGLWKKAISKNRLEEKVNAEKKQFQNAGTLIRTNNNIKDTLYGYAYRLNIDITLNYYAKGKSEIIKPKFSIPSVTVVYHQPRF